MPQTTEIIETHHKTPNNIKNKKKLIFFFFAGEFFRSPRTTLLELDQSIATHMGGSVTKVRLTNSRT
jgi:hypothetical protein